ncbi:T9SS type A sorting domain-containing protein [Spirosoma jeollabukense]
MKKRFYISLLLFSILSFYSLPVLSQWSTATLSRARSNIKAVTAGNKAVFAAGGAFSPLGSAIDVGDVDIYDVTTDQWTSTYRLSLEKANMSATSLGDLAFFAGGSFLTIRYYNTVDIYNSATNQWTTAQLSAARIAIGAAGAGNKVLFAGGYTYENGCNCFTNFNVVDIYNVTTNQWSTTQLPRLSGNVLATAVGNKVLFTGNGLIDIYDVTTGQWTAATIPQSQVALTAVGVGNKVLFAVGSFFASQVYIYDTATDQWTTGALSQVRGGISTTSLGSKVFFAGGVSSPSFLNSNVLDIYDAVTNQWTATQLPQLSGIVSSTKVGNKVFFAGNGTNKVDIYTVEAALPVNLISFSGAWKENIGAQLSWQTSLETNNDHFEIQRSANAKSFETIGRMQGKGTIQAHTDYTFTDADMPGQIGYYRLKQVDFDGSTHFSDIISVNRRESNPQAATLSIWPMPATGSLNFQLSTSKISQVTVYDLQGRQRLSTQMENQSTADVSGLPAGVYLLDVLTLDGQHLHKHFLKQ